MSASVTFYQQGRKYLWMFTINGYVVAQSPAHGYTRRRQASRGFYRFIARVSQHSAPSFKVEGLDA